MEMELDEKLNLLETKIVTLVEKVANMELEKEGFADSIAQLSAKCDELMGENAQLKQERELALVKLEQLFSKL